MSGDDPVEHPHEDVDVMHEEEEEPQYTLASPRRSTRAVAPKKQPVIDIAPATKRGGKRGSSSGRKGSVSAAKKAKKGALAVPASAAINWIACGIPSCGKWRIVTEEQFIQFSAPRAKVTCSLLGTGCDVDDDETRFPTIEAQTQHLMSIQKSISPAATKDASPKHHPAPVAVPVKLPTPKMQPQSVPVKEASPRHGPAQAVAPVKQSSPRHGPVPVKEPSPKHHSAPVAVPVKEASPKHEPVSIKQASPHHQPAPVPVHQKAPTPAVHQHSAPVSAHPVGAHHQSAPVHAHNVTAPVHHKPPTPKMHPHVAPVAEMKHHSAPQKPPTPKMHPQPAPVKDASPKHEHMKHEGHHEHKISNQQSQFARQLLMMHHHEMHT
jgi:hypothetical protein